ncbi:MAG TPA: response regulator [Clostridia bacterium]|nr:response regulator [Clostridia bacterium]
MKLLIVDDDLQIRTGLKEGIDWGKLEIDEVFIAENGIEAIKLYEENLPQIVITDIRMPGLDGLELSREIRKFSEATKIIIISGYSEFEYAKKALQLGVTDYLLKPVKIAELKKLVTTTKDKVIEALKREEEEKEQKYLCNERLIEDVLSGNIYEGKLIVDSFKKCLNMDVYGEIECLLFEIDRYVSVTKHLTYEQKKVIYLNIKSLIINLLDEKKVIIQQRLDKLVAIFVTNTNFSRERQTAKLIELHKALNRSLKEQFGISVSIGVGTPSSIINLSKIYQQSVQALSHKLYVGMESIIFFNDILINTENKYVEGVNEKELKEAISRYNYIGISAQISEKFECLKTLCSADRNLIKDVCADLKSILIRTVKDEGINFEGLFGNNMSLFDDIESFETIDEYKEWILNVYYIVITGLSDMSGIKHNTLMLKAAEYIKKNYNRNLTTEELSEHIQKNSNYFSHLFKKEFGVSFIEYLNKVRINEAKNLMKTTSLLAYEIAEKVGFQDYKYFTQVFKKLEGFSPSKLRKDNTTH